MGEHTDSNGLEPQRQPKTFWSWLVGPTLSALELRRAKRDFWILAAIWAAYLVAVPLIGIVKRVQNVLGSLGWPEHYGDQALLAATLTYFIPLFVIAPLLARVIERRLRNDRGVGDSAPQP